ncbi:MAG: hypothetical protein ACI9P8_000909, partial [Bacteroidia bacterium]
MNKSTYTFLIAGFLGLGLISCNESADSSNVADAPAKEEAKID